MSEQIELDNYLAHEKRLCRVEVSQETYGDTAKEIRHILKDMSKDMLEMKVDIHTMRWEYKSYFWKALGAIGSTMVIIITVSQFLIPYFRKL
tara:strand:- start:330 stop:605 length:276 start_codon:yes stop_codon:yes gene_type:complete